jgi:pyruvate/2-oxoglutarate dehydrogenase complex dihydrolipoamide dehydrogenase (E3) component
LVRHLDFNAVLLATGRTPNVEGMGLEEAGIEFDTRQGVKVNDKLVTTNGNVYAVGDVASKYQFTHNSDQMARIVVKNALFFGKEKYSNVILPWCTYTDPEIAHVGKYPKEMDEASIQYDTYKSDFHHNDRAICEEVSGFVKFHCKKGSDTILGCTIVGGPAGDMITHVTSAMFNKVGLKKIGACVTPYPTYADAIKACTG